MLIGSGIVSTAERTGGHQEGSAKMRVIRGLLGAAK